VSRQAAGRFLVSFVNVGVQVEIVRLLSVLRNGRSRWRSFAVTIVAGGRTNRRGTVRCGFVAVAPSASAAAPRAPAATFFAFWAAFALGAGRIQVAVVAAGYVAAGYLATHCVAACWTFAALGTLSSFCTLRPLGSSDALDSFGARRTLGPLGALAARWSSSAAITVIGQVGVEVEIQIAVDIQIDIFSCRLDIFLAPRRSRLSLFATTAPAATAAAAPPRKALALAGCRALGTVFASQLLVERQVGVFRGLIVEHGAAVVFRAAAWSSRLAQTWRLVLSRELAIEAEYVEVVGLGPEHVVELGPRCWFAGARRFWPQWYRSRRSFKCPRGKLVVALARLVPGRLAPGRLAPGRFMLGRRWRFAAGRLAPRRWCCFCLRRLWGRRRLGLGGNFEAERPGDSRPIRRRLRCRRTDFRLWRGLWFFRRQHRTWLFGGRWRFARRCFSFRLRSRLGFTHGNAKRFEQRIPAVRLSGFRHNRVR